jgi:phosphohistidine phosphatase
MVHLMLLRHAKSDWSDEGLLDVDRPLNSRGRKAAPEMAQWMQKHDRVPDRILCSSAKRTRETLERMLEAWKPTPEIHFIDRLYLAPPQTILEEALAHAKGAKSLLVIGHNPGIEMLATQLSDEPCEMRTCTVVIFEAEKNWPSDWWDSGSWTPIAKHRA